MLQEYPDDDVSCFLSSGRSVFSHKHMEGQFKNIYEPTMFDLVERSGQLHVEEGESGQFRKWLDPEPQERYIATADVCSGSTATDYSAISIWCRRGLMLEQVASYIGRPDPDELALMLDALGRFYNNAVVCPESNTYGRHTLKELRKLAYPCIYRQVAWNRAEGRIVRNTLGFETTAKSRPMLISASRKYLRASSKRIVIHDSDLLDQLGHFCYSASTNKPQAMDGCHDDYVFTMMIACLLDDEDSDLDEQFKPVKDKDAPVWTRVSEVHRVEDPDEEFDSIAEGLLSLGLY